MTCERDSFVFRHPGPPASFVDTFRDYYGPNMNAFAAARESGREEALRDELVGLVEAQNRSGVPDRTEVAATFLRVTARKG